MFIIAFILRLYNNVEFSDQLNQCCSYGEGVLGVCTSLPLKQKNNFFFFGQIIIPSNLINTLILYYRSTN